MTALRFPPALDPDFIPAEIWNRNYEAMVAADALWEGIDRILLVGGGTRMKIYEGMAMGRAIVSTTIGAEGLEYEPGRHLVVADDAEAFCAGPSNGGGDGTTGRRNLDR